jgi:hypothetical protein
MTMTAAAILCVAVQGGRTFGAPSTPTPDTGRTTLTRGEEVSWSRTAHTRLSVARQAAALQPQPTQNGVLSGFVRYASGEAIAGVRVRIGVSGELSPRTTRTGADGSYRFEAVPPGEYQVGASHAGAVARRITIAPGSTLTGIDFSMPDGGPRRVVTGRVVMKEASKKQPLPTRVGIGIIMRTDGTLVLPLSPGDHLVAVRLPEGYFLDSVTHGTAMPYSMDRNGRRLRAVNFPITVAPEPELIPELVITLGVSP